MGGALVMWGVIASLCMEFALLSLLAVGGASAVLPDMQRQAVDVHHWMSAPVFADLVALSQAAPVPNVLVVTLIGFQAAGALGAASATLAMCVPSSLLTFSVSRRLLHRESRSLSRRAGRVLAPLSVGLVLASGWSLARAHDSGQLPLLWVGAVASLSLWGKVHPLALLVGTGLLAQLAS